MPRGKALLILPYFGPFGPWFPLYLYGLARQQTLDLLLLSDAEPPALPPNARRLEMTLDQVRELATAKLGTSVRLQRTRNICDLKPAYGMVFEDFTKGYDYWAFGDEDVLYGDVERMLAPHLDGSADLVVPGTNSVRMQGSTQGHLTVLRNHARTNELAIRDPAYQRVLVSDEHWAYDETSWRYGGEISSFAKIVKAAEERGELSIRWGIPSVTHVPRRGRSYVYDGPRSARTTAESSSITTGEECGLSACAGPGPKMPRTVSLSTGTASTTRASDAVGSPCDGPRVACASSPATQGAVSASGAPPCVPNTPGPRRSVPERVLAAVDISRQLVLQTRSARMWAVARLLLTTSNVGRTLIVEKGARMPQHFRNPTEPRRTISSSLAALLCAAMMMPLQLAAKEAPTVPEPSQTYSRGDVVTLAAAPDGTRQPDSKVLAVPGDRIQVARTGITVNDEPVKEVSADFLAGLPEDTWAQVVPADHYFVMAEQRAATGVTRFWGLIPVQRISGRR